MIISFGQQHEQIKIEVLKYEGPAESNDEYDRNWLSVEVSVMAGSFRAKEQIAILTWDLEKLLEQLEPLHTSLTGTAIFETIEDQLKLQFDADGLGQCSLAGQLSSPTPDSNVLIFHLKLDQSDLSPSISQLKRAVIEFPTR